MPPSSRASAVAANSAAEAVRAEADDRLAAAVAAAPVALVALDPEGCAAFWSARFAALTGLSPEARGRSFADLFGSSAAPSGLGDARTKLHRTADAPIEIEWSLDPTVGWIGVALSAATVVETDGGAAARDPLTGLLTRASLLDAMRRVRQEEPGRPIRVMALDLDHFKAVNDTLGHPIGDAVLAKVGERLTSTVGEGHAIARFGGDEFIIALFGEKAVSEAVELGPRIVDVLSRPYLIDGHLVNIGASVGSARVAAGGENDDRAEASVFDETLRQADVALYHSKRSGRGRCSFFEAEMDERLQARRELEGELRKALPLRQFQVRYQPQFDAASGALLGFEALLRWANPKRGLLLPQDFLQVAEDTGLIKSIGAWVLDDACRVASRWPEHLTIAVNASATQFLDDEFVSIVRRALHRAQLAPQRLEIEITETALLTDETVAQDRIAALRDLGATLSIDDFGTGYSSLAYLRKYRFDKIKIDQSFVRADESDRDARSIVTAVASLGAAFGLTTVAEGVETEAQLERIRADGCQAAQGFLMSEPLPVDDLDAFIASKEPANPAGKEHSR